MSTTIKRNVTWLVAAVVIGNALWFAISTAAFHYRTPTPYREILLGISFICVVIRFILARLTNRDAHTHAI